MSKIILMQDKKPLCEFVDHDGKDITIRSYVDQYGYTEILDDSGQYIDLFVSNENIKKIKKITESMMKIYEVVQRND